MLLQVTFSSYAQERARVSRSHRMDRELQLSYDNDVYFLTDRYYSSGANIAYSRFIQPDSKFYRRFRSKRSDALKVITRFHYGHRIYTPNEIKERDVDNFDRPYAGWHYLKFQMLNFPARNTANRYTVEFGLVGNRSGIGNFQEWWHNSFNIEQPRGWQFQISSEPVINLGYDRIKNWRLAKKIKLMTSSGVQLGNGQNKVDQEVMLRVGKFNDLINSSIINSRVSGQMPKRGVYPKDGEEGFVFCGINASYVLSDIFIEGSLFNNESPHTEDIHNLVFIRRWGFMYSNYYVTFFFTFYRVGREVVGGRSHRFLNLNLAFRF